MRQAKRKEIVKIKAEIKECDKSKIEKSQLNKA